MMDRRHQEDSPARSKTPPRVAEPTRLQTHRRGFHHNHPAGYDQHERLVNQHRDNAERAAQRERSAVPHEHLRGMTVKPQETETSPQHRRTKHRKFSRADDMRNVEIL